MPQSGVYQNGYNCTAAFKMGEFVTVLPKLSLYLFCSLEVDSPSLVLRFSTSFDIYSTVLLGSMVQYHSKQF